MIKGINRLSPAAAMSLNRGCEERPSMRKEGWEVGTEEAGAGAGPPGNRGQQHTRVSVHFFMPTPNSASSMLLLNRSRQVGQHIHTGGKQVYTRSLLCFALKGVIESFKESILPLSERSPSRSSSSPPAEAGLVGIVVWITGTTSLPPSRSNKSLAWGTRTKCKQ